MYLMLVCHCIIFWLSKTSCKLKLSRPSTNVHCEKVAYKFTNVHIFFFSVNELLKMKEELTKERDEQLNDIVKLRESLAQATSQQQKLESDKKECEEKIQEVIKVLVFNILKKK